MRTLLQRSCFGDLIFGRGGRRSAGAAGWDWGRHAHHVRDLLISACLRICGPGGTGAREDTRKVARSPVAQANDPLGLLEDGLDVEETLLADHGGDNDDTGPEQLGGGDEAQVVSPGVFLAQGGAVVAVAAVIDVLTDVLAVLQLPDLVGLQPVGCALTDSRGVGEIAVDLRGHGGEEAAGSW